MSSIDDNTRPGVQTGGQVSFNEAYSFFFRRRIVIVIPWKSAFVWIIFLKNISSGWRFWSQNGKEQPSVPAHYRPWPFACAAAIITRISVGAAPTASVRNVFDGVQRGYSRQNHSLLCPFEDIFWCVRGSGLGKYYLERLYRFCMCKHKTVLSYSDGMCRSVGETSCILYFATLKVIPVHPASCRDVCLRAFYQREWRILLIFDNWK